MEIKEYMYNGKVVEFFFGDDIMVNATEMASVFNKKTYHFLQLESTQKWIKWLENNAIRANRTRDSRARYSGKASLPGEIKYRTRDLIPILIVEKGGSEGGATWMNRLLAIEFAMWLDIDFKGWIILKIDQLLYDYGFGKRNIVLEKVKLIVERERLFEENKDDEVVSRIKVIEDTLKSLKGEELNLNKNFNKSIFD